jgi:hypothetical protein
MICSNILMSFSPNTYLYTIVSINTKISSSMILSISINTYRCNMILSEETLWYPAALYCPSTLIHTGTIWYCQKSQDIQQYIIVFLHWFIPVWYDIDRRNSKIASSMLISFSINTYLYNMILSEETLRYPAACPTTLIHITCTLWYCKKNPLRYPAACYCSFSLIYTCTIWYCQMKQKDIQQHVIVLFH